jgi:hypothetical protein
VDILFIPQKLINPTKSSPVFLPSFPWGRVAINRDISRDSYTDKSPEFIYVGNSYIRARLKSYLEQIKGILICSKYGKNGHNSSMQLML